MVKDTRKMSWEPELSDPSLIIGWNSDAGKVGEAVTDFLNRQLCGQSFSEIESSEFFPMNGITIEDDLIEFPECKFYASPGNNILIFKSPPPIYEWYKFFNHVLDVAEYFKVQEIYTMGGMPSLITHNDSRYLFGTFSSLEMKQHLSHFDISNSNNYETPPGQKPTLNSFFLWTVRRRNLKGVSLWTPVPFYLMSVDDPKSQKCLIEFFQERFQFEIDLTGLDEAEETQNRQILEARSRNHEIDDYMLRLESNLTLSEDENIKLVKQVEEFLKRG